MVAQGSIVDVQLTSDTGLGVADGVIQKAVSIINKNGQVTSINPKVTTSFLSGFLNTVTSLNMDQPFQVDFPVLCNVDFNSPEDVASIVANAFYQVTSNYPTGISPVSVTPPSSDGTTPALSTSGIAGNDTGAGAAVTSLSGSISSTLSQLGNLGTNLLIGLAAIIVLAIVLIAYGPNIGKIASAA
jgi:hypothetical protein